MSDDTNALVARLRRWHSEGGSLTARDAADAIERLERELAETRVDRDLHYSRCASLIFSEPFSKVTNAEIQKWHREYVADRDAIAERCEKLREALQELVRCDEIVKHGQHERGEKVKGGRWARAWDRARAALKDAS